MRWINTKISICDKSKIIRMCEPLEIIFQIKALFTRSAKTFVCRAYFSFFKQNIERKNYQRTIKKF